MRSIKRERGVLKLVHPGRYVEVHREPIRAAEVMRRNPRHSITRPDVFKFPWIVVKPESVLLPGSVFLIVPNHTIYHLLKAKEQINNNHLPPPFSQQNQSSPNNHKQHIKGKLHMFNKIFLPFSFLFPFSQTSPNCLSKTIMCSPDWEETVELWSNNMISYEDIRLEMHKKDVNFECVPNEQVTMLKSCLKRPNSICKSLDLKVSFNIPIEKDEDKGYSLSLSH